MAGGGKKNFTKSRSRKPSSSSARALFVEGGVLADWSAVGSPPSRGRSSNSGTGNGRSKSATRSGNSGRSIPCGSRNESQRPKGNAFGYMYPDLNIQESSLPDGGSNGDEKLDESHPIILVDTKETQIVAFLDQAPVMESQTVKYAYDYGASFELDDSSHRGLGFPDEAEANPSVIGASPNLEEKEGSCVDLSSSEEMETDTGFVHEASNVMGDALLDEVSSPEQNPGFLSIGGMKLYTQDVSDEEGFGEDSQKEWLDEESLYSSESEDSSSSSDSDGLSDSGSDIDEEIAKDYFEGIGGSYKVANVDQLLGQVRNDSIDDGTSGRRFNETLERLGGIALQDESREYGMKKPRSRRKNLAKSSKSGPASYDWSASLDDSMLVKDPRTLYGKKKHGARFPQSWPSEAQKIKNFRNFPGEKKKLRKEMIASKRRERMIRRGVDLEKINCKLQQMVEDGLDISSFQLMHSRDCSQVQRLAAIYRLRSNCLGSGRRRFVTVTRTEHTCMPSSSDRVRLEKLLGVGNEDADFTVNNSKAGKADTNRTKKASKGAVLSSLGSKSSPSKSFKNSVILHGSNETSKKKRREKTGSFAVQPVSFVSSGNMVSETVDSIVIDSTGTKHTSHENRSVATTSSNYGAFEMHTTGFGSKMMAKMGYIDGEGLGKDGRGMAEPIEVIQRPKSLGLGAQVPETNISEPMNVNRQPKSHGPGSRVPETSGKSGKPQFGSFEKHTKGFGSKMMEKMGFVEGMGLGRDSQGMVNPLVAARLPKSRGLGAKG